MLNFVCAKAREADAWLIERVKFYRVILGWGLILTILDTVRKLSHDLSGKSLHSTKDFLSMLFLLVFQAALLINQLAQWRENTERRRAKRAARSAQQ